jgi:hypothetical protein
VGRRAVPPSTLRANPVVKSLTVEAGMSGRSGFRLQSIRPDSSVTAMPHSPGAERLAWPYHESRRSVSQGAPVCAASDAKGIWRHAATARTTVWRRNDERRTTLPDVRGSGNLSGRI